LQWSRRKLDERLAVPFACKVIQLLIEREIEEGFKSLLDAMNMLHMVKDELKYTCNYYDYLVDEGRLVR
jgi:hypothetical protein